MVAGRLILEEIQKDPVIYRAHFKGDPCNSYLVVSMNESLAVDVRSPGMRDKLRILAAGLGAAPERMLYFDTGGNSVDSMIAINDSPRGQSAVGTKREEGIWRTLEIRNIDARDGDKIKLGDKILHCVRSTGASNAQMSLWIPEHRILLAGEAVGCDPLPKIRDTNDRKDMLGLMFETIRFFKSLNPVCILPGKGEAAHTAPECQALLDGMMGKYCLQLLQYYQLIRDHPGHTVEWLEEEIGRRSLGRECYCVAIHKYLLYRKYVRAKEGEDGAVVYEPGSTRLTRWNALAIDSSKTVNTKKPNRNQGISL